MVRRTNGEKRFALAATAAILFEISLSDPLLDDRRVAKSEYLSAAVAQYADLCLRSDFRMLADPCLTGTVPTFCTDGPEKKQVIRAKCGNRCVALSPRAAAGEGLLRAAAQTSGRDRRESPLQGGSERRSAVSSLCGALGVHHEERVADLHERALADERVRAADVLDHPHLVDV